tara:strand:- start:528 stop:716 length:189 start_codon:yes stop_codon:yes gene_type:complete
MKTIVLLLAVAALSSCSFNAGVEGAKTALGGAINVKLEPEEACVCLSWSGLFRGFRKEISAQ